MRLILRGSVFVRENEGGGVGTGPPGAAERIAFGANGSPHLPSIVSSAGVRWVDLRRTLTPRYGIVWRDIALCYLFLLLGVLVVAVAEHAARSSVPAAAVAVPAVLWLGYWLHALFLFGHEAAHANLARPRSRNDRVGDWVVWVMFGSTTRNYRRTHMTHHGHLGDHEDTETTYHLCLSIVNMLKASTGLYVLEVLLRKARASAGRPARRGTRSSGTVAGVLASLRSALLHTAVVGGLWLGGSPVAAVTWVAAMGGVFPLLATVRTILEHRRADAPCAADFAVETHGPVNRLFGTGVVSRYFGSAGFNRHLLHHWDPAISYTRFDEMERFFRDTPLAARMDANRIGYGTAVRMLMAEARRG
jgi:fatty acid desaturase